MPLLAVIRHGPTAWTDEKRIQGRSDVPLSLNGRAQVSSWSLPRQFQRFVWEASPLRRARQTAQLLSAAPVRRESRLIEMNWGRWEGQRRADLMATQDIDVTRAEARGMAFCPPGGESPADVMARLKPWLVGLAHRRRSTFAVTHKGVIRVLLAMATSWDMTGRAPAKVRFGAVQLFSVSMAGQLKVEALEIRCAPR